MSIRLLCGFPVLIGSLSFILFVTREVSSITATLHLISSPQLLHSLQQLFQSVSAPNASLSFFISGLTRPARSRSTRSSQAISKEGCVGTEGRREDAMGMLNMRE